MSMKWAKAAIDAVAGEAGAWADARSNVLLEENLRLRNGRLVRAKRSEDRGLGVRVRTAQGAFGFAAGACSSESDARAIAERALRTARSLSSAMVEPGPWRARSGRVDSWKTPLEIDPFGVSLAEKRDLLVKCDEAMRGREADGVLARTASLASRREEQWFASTEGDELHQELVRIGAGISVTASRGGVLQTRSYPASFGGNYQSGGYELVLAMELPEHGERVRDEALLLCDAEPCPAGERDLILGGSQLMLQIHESVGHPNEIDRVHGQEVDLAGSSFATTDKLGSFRYGSDLVNLVADSTVEGGLDTRGFDDDGTPSKRWHVVKDGLFTGYHTNREWADRLGEEESRGTNRAEGWWSPPMVRITNLSLEPGSGTLDELVADTEDGVLADTVKMWSIDQRRLNFQFTTEIAWRIEGGKRTKLLRDATYQGTTPEFWRSCDAICGPEEFQLWGVANCGKGNPMQVAEMSHGAAPARFRGVTFIT